MKVSTSRLHHILIKKIIEDGYAPDNDWLEDFFSCSTSELISSLKLLEKEHGLVLHPNTSKIWVIHPFSLAPTNFVLTSGVRKWWSNCAWCSLGAACLIGNDVKIHTTLAGEEKPLTISIKKGILSRTDLWIHFPIPMKKAWDNVIYTCSTMLFFESEEQIQRWCDDHKIPRGDVQPISRIWKFASKWYGNHLNPHWKKWSIEEAQKIFEELDLSHSIWDLDEQKGNF